MDNNLSKAHPTFEGIDDFNLIVVSVTAISHVEQT